MEQSGVVAVVGPVEVRFKPVVGLGTAQEGLELGVVFNSAIFADAKDALAFEPATSRGEWLYLPVTWINDALED